MESKMTRSRPLRIAIVGLGRMGMIHAIHAHELSRETGLCELVALATANPVEAEQFAAQTGAVIPIFSSIAELASAHICDAAVVATSTGLHREHATLMLEAGQRILLEKPLTGTLEGDREFCTYLDRSYPNDVMLGFQRRFDAPLRFAKQLLEDGAIGRLFKVYSALEDSAPAPDGFKSTGIVADMGIHNVDEILWFSNRLPQSASVVGSRVYSHNLTSCVEDFDDALLLLDFGGKAGEELIAALQVGRNHVSGYRSETILYGEGGQIHIGRFNGNPREVLVEAYGRRDVTRPIVSKAFATREYMGPLPEFIDRFGAAYKEELRTFVECCLSGDRFPVTHLDALRAQEIIETGMSDVLSRSTMTEISYSDLATIG